MWPLLLPLLGGAAIGALTNLNHPNQMLKNAAIGAGLGGGAGLAFPAMGAGMAGAMGLGASAPAAAGAGAVSGPLLGMGPTALNSAAVTGPAGLSTVLGTASPAAEGGIMGALNSKFGSGLAMGLGSAAPQLVSALKTQPQGMVQAPGFSGGGPRVAASQQLQNPVMARAGFRPLLGSYLR